MSAFLVRAVLAILVICLPFASAHAEEWRVLASGLELREFLIPDQVGDLEGRQGGMAVLRINPDMYDVRLGSALNSGRMRSMQEWSLHSRFVAVINAGMFRADDRMRSTGYMRDASVEINPYIHPNYGAFLAFQPRKSSLPPLRWVDRKSDPDWQAVLADYDGIIQNFRLISRERENLWEQSPSRHSGAAIAMDRGGRLLFIHCRPRLSMHEFAQALLDLPLDLIGAMYVEGGADAAMYIDVDGYVGRFVGEYRSDFFQGSNRNFWPAPNVLGVQPR
ncbi:MAG: phosphodiester glycosidase family protein [Desulfomicrobium sp.]|nr:phosphodiester glycosidase family protein [Desulfomicrobium sp.]